LKILLSVFVSLIVYISIWFAGSSPLLPLIIIQIIPILIFLIIYTQNPFTFIIDNKSCIGTELSEDILIPYCWDFLFKPHSKFENIFLAISLPGFGFILFIYFIPNLIKSGKILKQYSVTNDLLEIFYNRGKK